ncbi:LysR family transcriptional regulator [Streptococcus ratti]|uniref:LysR family transcriptional regulator n=1 Tax=Streptococcus ratti TaxID=1341 RepID=UPI001FECE987|nr:LysR family transcriptional regulator [Streptococcus ratti]
MEIRDIEYVKAVVDKGSITKAAQALYITQPSLSTYIKNMQQLTYKKGNGRILPY